MRRDVVPLLSICDVTLKYPRESRAVLRNLSMQFYPDTSVCIMGPSGSGKSTLLALLGALIRPSEGEILRNGVSVWSSREALRKLRSEVAWILQSANVISAMPARLNASLAALVGGLPPTAALAAAERELVEVGLGAVSDKPVKLLSGGQAQRVTVARTLASAAPIILADEPTGQLDQSTTKQIAEVLSSRVSPGGLTVIATHDDNVAATCDSVYILEDGKVRRA